VIFALVREALCVIIVGYVCGRAGFRRGRGQGWQEGAQFISEIALGRGGDPGSSDRVEAQRAAAPWQ
jgi:hypothetical protein